MQTKSRKVHTHCNGCKRGTNHKVLFSKIVTEVDEPDDDSFPPIRESRDFMVIQCDGCDEISFLERVSGDVYSNSDDSPSYFDFNYPTNQYDIEVNFLIDDEKNKLPKLLADLYQEVEGAFKEESNILAGVGLRMLVEAICIEQKITGGNLKLQIPKLHLAGLISSNEVPILDKLRQIGNFSAHSIKGFSLDKLEYALDIINHILKSIYILPMINKKLRI
jgi:ribosomal protein S27E